MKYFINTSGEVFAYSEDQLALVELSSDIRKMSNTETDKHLNPEKYLSDEEKSQLIRDRMPTLSPIEFDLLLDRHDLYDVVQDLISTNRTLKIAYTRATFFSRNDPFIDQARVALNLTDEQVDEMWMN